MKINLADYKIRDYLTWDAFKNIELGDVIYRIRTKSDGELLTKDRIVITDNSLDSMRGLNQDNEVIDLTEYIINQSKLYDNGRYMELIHDDYTDTLYSSIYRNLNYKVNSNKNKDIIYRCVAYSDFDRLCDIDKLCFQEGIWYEKEIFLALIEHALDGSVMFDVAEHKTEGVIGFVASYRSHVTAYTIITIDILENYRGTGIAQELFDRTVEFYISIPSIKYCVLQVAINNKAAIKFYRKNGFTSLNYIKNYYTCTDGTRIDAIECIKNIG